MLSASDLISTQTSTSNINSGSNTAQIVPVPMPIIDTTVTVLEPSSPELTYVTGRSSGLSAEELAKILAATGLLATATAGVGLQMTETARRRKEELEAERLAGQVRLEKERIAQAERARENVEMNAQMREDAQKEVFIEVEQSEANKRYHEHVAALWDQYYRHLEAWNQHQQALAMARTQAYILEPGSTIADLPQNIQDIFWELGNLSLEYAQHTERDANGNSILDGAGNPITWTTHDADGQWAFQEKERGDLGYYQYLIRTALAEGDMQAVIEHTQSAASYIDNTLAARIGREMTYTQETTSKGVLRDQNAIRGVQMPIIDNPVWPPTYNRGSVDSLYKDLRQRTMQGMSDLNNALDVRGDELSTEMNLRNRSHLSGIVDFQETQQQIIGGAAILGNMDSIMNQAESIYLTHNPVRYVSIGNTYVQQDNQTPPLEGCNGDCDPWVEMVHLAESSPHVNDMAMMTVLNAFGVNVSVVSGDQANLNTVLNANSEEVLQWGTVTGENVYTDYFANETVQATWTPEAIRNVYNGVMDTSAAFLGYYNSPYMRDALATAAYAEIDETDIYMQQALLFNIMMGQVDLRVSDWQNPDGLGQTFFYDPDEHPDEEADTQRTNVIKFYSNHPNWNGSSGVWNTQEWFKYNLVHELGHVLNNRLFSRGSNDVFALSDPGRPNSYGPSMRTQGWWRGSVSNRNEIWYGGGGPNGEMATRQVAAGEEDLNYYEEFADMFLYWVYTSPDVLERNRRLYNADSVLVDQPETSPWNLDGGGRLVNNFGLEWYDPASDSLVRIPDPDEGGGMSPDQLRYYWMQNKMDDWMILRFLRTQPLDVIVTAMFGSDVTASMQTATISGATMVNVRFDIPPEAVDPTTVTDDWRIARSIQPGTTVNVIGLDADTGYYFIVDEESQTAGWVHPYFIDGVTPTDAASFNNFGADNPDAYYGYTGRPSLITIEGE